MPGAQRDSGANDDRDFEMHVVLDWGNIIWEKGEEIENGKACARRKKKRKSRISATEREAGLVDV